MNLVARITMVFAVAFGIGFYLFVSQEREATIRQYREATEEPLVDTAYILAGLISERSARQGALVPRELREAFNSASREVPRARIYDIEKRTIDTRVLVSDENGIVQFDSRSGEAEGQRFGHWLDVSRALRGEYGARTSYDPVAGCSTMFISAPIKKEGRIRGVATVAKPNCTANRFIETAQKSTTFLGLLTFASSLVVALLAGLLINRPLARLTAYARAVRDGEKASLPALPPGEVRTLGEALEEMREALEGKQYIEQYVRTLSHELKSPITAIRGSSELLEEDLPAPQRERFLHNIRSETSRMDGLVSKLMTLSTIEATRLAGFEEEIEIGSLLREIAGDLAANAEVKGVSLECTAEGTLMIRGNRLWLKEALANLVQNAIDFSDDGGAVTLNARAVADTALIKVSDEGPGIPEWALPKIFDRFFSLPRPGSTRKSSGLGLSLVREIAIRHGGSLTLRNKEKGAVASFVLPLAGPGPATQS